MRRLVYLKSANADLANILRYVTRESGSLAVGRDVVVRYQRKCERLADLPSRQGTARTDLREELRSSPCQGYVIFFRYGVETLEIVSVLHGSRDVVAYFDEG